MFTGIALSSIQDVYLFLGDHGRFHAPINFFDPLSGSSNLSQLRITGESLKEFHPYLRNLTHLKNLTIDYSDLGVIYPEYFEGMLGLRGLDLSYNKISDLNPLEKSWNVTNLTTLNLKHNYLLKVSYYALEGLTNLLTLDLSENPYLTYFSALLFPGLSNLRHLYLSGTTLLRYLEISFICQT